jgi:apolipoprotein N-acyltransferase
MPIGHDRPSPPPVVRSLRWWQCLLAGVLFGLALVFAFPPGSLAIAGPLAIVPLVLVAARVGTGGPRGRLRRAALLVGLGALPSLAYLHAFIIDITAPGYPLLCLYLSAYPAAFVLLLGLWLRRVGTKAIGRRVPVAMVAATLWVGMEMLRGEWLLGGYPWYYIGHPLIDFWPIAVAASGFGAIGVSLMAAMPAGLIAEHLSPGPVSRRIGSWVVAGLVCVGMPVVASMTRTPVAPPAAAATAAAGTFRVGVIQTDVPQSNKGSGTGADRRFRMLRWLDLTRQAAAPDAQGRRPGVILWPETMFPGTALNPEAVRVARENDLSYALANGRRAALHEFADLLTRQQAELNVPMIVGAIAIDGWKITVRPDGSIDDSFDGKFNSAMLIRGGQVEQMRYDKRRLAPFGETLPLVGAFPTLKRWIMAVGARGMTFELSEGTKNTRFELSATVPSAPANTPANTPDSAAAASPTVRIATPICFEIAYPESCRSLAYERGRHAADLLVNLSNDGWFGAYAVGRPGHMLLCRWRCVELGLPMVRSVNTGISGVIDSRGRIIATALPATAPTPAEPGPGYTPQERILVHDVPMNENARTLFGIIGDITGWLCVGLAAVWCVLLMVLRPEPTPSAHAGDNHP